MSVTVLVVDDSSFFRKRVCEILGSVPEIKIVGTAANGREAIELAKKLRPDVITMDYEMPVMDGVTAVRHIMADCPTAILMFSSLTYEGARVTLDALEAGAVDYLPKNFEDIARDVSRMQQVLKSRILTLARLKGGALKAQDPHPVAPTPAQEIQRPAEKPHTSARSPVRGSASIVSKPSLVRANASPSKPKRLSHKVDLLVIGSSTGGPVALQKILTALPAHLPVPVLVIQHMPATFTPAFSDRLDSLCQVRVKHAEDGDVLKPGHVYVAPGGKQMIISPHGSSRSLRILEGDDRLTYKPSVDLTFGSAAKACPGKVLAIVLTGMGSDGREGCKLLKRSGASVWTQSADTCVIYGMPMAVDKAGLTDESIGLNEMAKRIVEELC